MKKYSNLLSLIFLFILILLYTLTFLTTIGWILLLFYLLLLIVVSLSMYSSLKNLSFEVDKRLHLHKDEKVTITIKMFKNNHKKVFYPILNLSIPTLAYENKISAYSGRTTSLIIDWQPKNRQYLAIVPIKLSVSDPFGILKKTYQFNLLAEWVILPKVLSDEKLQQLFLNSSLPDSFGEASFNIKQFRPYYPGDNVKAIDWKQSSKLQEIILREYEYTIDSPQLFIFYGVKSFYFERMLSVFFTIDRLGKDTNNIFYLTGTDFNEATSPTDLEYASLAKQAAPSLDMFLTRKNITIFTPERTHLLDKELAKFMPLDTINIISYQDIIKEG